MFPKHAIDQKLLHFIRAIFHEATVQGTRMSTFTVE
ncbi:RAxF-45 family protein [Halobacillus salinarum]|nr:RAxF-45 family protein [Halobacillus salinarum]